MERIAVSRGSLDDEAAINLRAVLMGTVVHAGCPIESILRSCHRSASFAKRSCASRSSKLFLGFMDEVS